MSVSRAILASPCPGEKSESALISGNWMSVSSLILASPCPGEKRESAPFSDNWMSISRAILASPCPGAKSESAPFSGNWMSVSIFAGARWSVSAGEPVHGSGSILFSTDREDAYLGSVSTLYYSTFGKHTFLWPAMATVSGWGLATEQGEPPGT